MRRPPVPARSHEVRWERWRRPLWRWSVFSCGPGGVWFETKPGFWIRRRAVAHAGDRQMFALMWGYPFDYQVRPTP